MFIDINKIDEDGLSFDRTLDLSDLDDGTDQAISIGEVHLRGRIVRNGRVANLAGRLDAKVRLSCARCLEPFDVTVGGEFALRLIADEPGPEAGRVPDADGDEALFHAPEGRVDLREIATEQIYLSLPMKPVCREDCKGLCPACGANRNVDECGCPQEPEDPRLAPLRDLKQRLSDS
jgi:uncharacterized protein